MDFFLPQHLEIELHIENLQFRWTWIIDIFFHITSVIQQPFVNYNRSEAGEKSVGTPKQHPRTQIKGFSCPSDTCVLFLPIQVCWSETIGARLVLPVCTCQPLCCRRSKLVPNIFPTLFNVAVFSARNLFWVFIHSQRRKFPLQFLARPMLFE